VLTLMSICRCALGVIRIGLLSRPADNTRWVSNVTARFGVGVIIMLVKQVFQSGKRTHQHVPARKQTEPQFQPGIMKRLPSSEITRCGGVVTERGAFSPLSALGKR